MWGLWIPGTLYVVKAQNGSKDFQRATVSFYIFWKKNKYYIHWIFTQKLKHWQNGNKSRGFTAIFSK